MANKNRGYLYGKIEDIRPTYITLRLTTGSLVKINSWKPVFDKWLDDLFSKYVFADVVVRLATLKTKSGHVFQRIDPYGDRSMRKYTDTVKTKSLIRDLEESTVNVKGKAGSVGQNYGTQHVNADNLSMAGVKKEEKKPDRVKCAMMIVDGKYTDRRRCRSKAVLGSRYCRTHTITPTGIGDFDDPRYSNMPKPFDAKWDMPNTRQQALDVLEIWSKAKNQLSFSCTRAKRIYEIFKIAD